MKKPTWRSIGIAVVAAGAVAAGYLAWSPSSQQAAAASKSARNLLLISVDALRADVLGCYGGRPDVSVTIDSLAREGALFENCYAPMGMTMPSVTTLLTSKYPEEHGVMTNMARLPDSERTLGECLSDAGFRTRAILGNGALAPEYSNLAQGFAKGDCTRTYKDNDLLKAAIDMIKSGFGRDRREFLWLHFMSPHAPYEPWGEIAASFETGPYAGTLDGTGATLDPVFVARTKLAQSDLDHVRALYLAEVKVVDVMIRVILGALSDAGAAENTLVVFVADHGEELYDHQFYFYHANSPYRSVTRIPLIFRMPGLVPAGSRLDSLAETGDVMPTMLELLDVPYVGDDSGERPRGSSLAPILLGQQRAVRSFACSQVGDGIQAARTERWSYIRNPTGFMPRSVPEAGEYVVPPAALYDLSVDPNEQVDVLAHHPDVVAHMERGLDAWSVRQRRARPQMAAKLPPQRLAELRELGYLGGN